MSASYRRKGFVVGKWYPSGVPYEGSWAVLYSEGGTINSECRLGRNGRWHLYDGTEQFWRWAASARLLWQWLWGAEAHTCSCGMTVIHSTSTDTGKDAMTSWDDVLSIATKHPVTLLHMLRSACGVLEREPMMWDICRGGKGSYCLDWISFFCLLLSLFLPFLWIGECDLISRCLLGLACSPLVELALQLGEPQCFETWDPSLLLYPRKNTNNLLNNNKIPLLTTVKNLLETLLSLLTQRNTELPFWLDAKHIHIKYTHLRQPCDMGFPHSIRKSFAPNNLSTALFSSHLSCLNLFVLFILSSPIPSTTEGLIQPASLPSATLPDCTEMWFSCKFSFYSPRARCWRPCTSNSILINFSLLPARRARISPSSPFPWVG